MTLSHAFEETPNTINNVLTQLNSVIKTKLEQAQAGAENKGRVEGRFNHL